MLKETENEETRFFCQICVIGGISIEGSRGPTWPLRWATPLATPMILRYAPLSSFITKTFKAKLK